MLFTRFTLFGLASVAVARTTDFARGTDKPENSTANAARACSELAHKFPTKLYLPNTANFNEEATGEHSFPSLPLPPCPSLAVSTFTLD